MAKDTPLSYYQYAGKKVQVRYVFTFIPGDPIIPGYPLGPEVPYIIKKTVKKKKSKKQPLCNKPLRSSSCAMSVRH